MCKTSYNGMPFQTEKKISLTNEKFRVRNKKLEHAKDILTKIKEK